MGYFGAILIGILIFLIIPYMIWANAFVMSILWGWFAVTIFNFRPLTVAQAAGLMVITMLLLQRYENKENSDEITAKRVGRIFAHLLSPWIILFYGWVIKNYFM